MMQKLESSHEFIPRCGLPVYRDGKQRGTCGRPEGHEDDCAARMDDALAGEALVRKDDG